jgi:predicted flap endonuclease-1-like 5' DNA nuclease
MIYLIGHLFWFMILTGALAGMAGAAWHSMRSQTRAEGLAAERERLLRSLTDAGVEKSAGAAMTPELERQMDAHRLRADMAQARAAQSDRAAEAARARAEEAAGRVAELERALERGGGADTGELTRLREQVAAHEAQNRQVLDVEAAPAPPAEDESAAQSWRLRYFEQRVRYLEEEARAARPPTGDEQSGAQPMEWRARLAEARANHLENELRAASSTEDGSPASEPNGDALRWRASYLEKRLQHLGAQEVSEPQPQSASEPDNAGELAKWRARYLESRVRHLEAQAAQAPAQPQPAGEPPLAQPTPPDDAAPGAPAHQPEPEHEPAHGPLHEEPAHADESHEEEAAPAPLVPAGAEERPPALPAAQSGAPDDLSLIEGVSQLQQSTLNALGVYHFDQIAAWTPANIAWVDQYLRLRGRIVSENWIAQAARLAHEGPEAIRALEEERV